MQEIWKDKFLNTMVKLLRKSKKDKLERGFSIFRIDDSGEIVRSKIIKGTEEKIYLPKYLPIDDSHEYIGNFHTHIDAPALSSADIFDELTEMEEKKYLHTSVKLLDLKDLDLLGHICIGHIDNLEEKIICYEIDWDSVDDHILTDFIVDNLDLAHLGVIEEDVKSLEDVSEVKKRLPNFKSLVSPKGELKEKYSLEEFQNVVDNRIKELREERENLIKEIEKHTKTQRIF